MNIYITEYPTIREQKFFLNTHNFFWYSITKKTLKGGIPQTMQVNWTHVMGTHKERNYIWAKHRYIHWESKNKYKVSKYKHNSFRLFQRRVTHTWKLINKVVNFQYS